jgi:hypothetical protein
VNAGTLQWPSAALVKAQQTTRMQVTDQYRWLLAVAELAEYHLTVPLLRRAGGFLHHPPIA